MNNCNYSYCFVESSRLSHYAWHFVCGFVCNIFVGKSCEMNALLGSYDSVPQSNCMNVFAHTHHTTMTTMETMHTCLFCIVKRKLFVQYLSREQKAKRTDMDDEWRVTLLFLRKYDFIFSQRQRLKLWKMFRWMNSVWRNWLDNRNQVVSQQIPSSK